jgi:hypothetical protein
MDDRIVEAMRQRLLDGQLPCATAHAVARDLGVEPLAVGRAADEAGIRISRCQLGLFGYGPKAEGKHKIVQAMDPVPEELAARLRDAAGEAGIPCETVWAMADRVGMRRLDASGAVEGLALRVSRCQLGCFPRPKAG